MKKRAAIGFVALFALLSAIALSVFRSGAVRLEHSSPAAGLVTRQSEAVAATVDPTMPIQDASTRSQVVELTIVDDITREPIPALQIVLMGRDANELELVSDSRGSIAVESGEFELRSAKDPRAFEPRVISITEVARQSVEVCTCGYVLVDVVGGDVGESSTLTCWLVSSPFGATTNELVERVAQSTQPVEEVRSWAASRPDAVPLHLGEPIRVAPSSRHHVLACHDELLGVFPVHAHWTVGRSELPVGSQRVSFLRQESRVCPLSAPITVLPGETATIAVRIGRGHTMRLQPVNLPEFPDHVHLKLAKRFGDANTSYYKVWERLSVSHNGARPRLEFTKLIPGRYSVSGVVVSSGVYYCICERLDVHGDMVAEISSDGRKGVIHLDCTGIDWRGSAFVQIWPTAGQDLSFEERSFAVSFKLSELQRHMTFRGLPSNRCDVTLSLDDPGSTKLTFSSDASGRVVF